VKYLELEVSDSFRILQFGHVRLGLHSHKPDMLIAIFGCWNNQLIKWNKWMVLPNTQQNHNRIASNYKSTRSSLCILSSNTEVSFSFYLTSVLCDAHRNK